MKIIAGTLKGRNFYMPEGIRPTQNLVRKAIFDILVDDFVGATFLDLFAGSGAVGFEAISRGAGNVTLVEKDERFCEIIRDNLDLLQVPRPNYNVGRVGENRRQVYELINSDAFASIKVFARQARKFDIVFADPPYGVELAKKILKTLGAYDIVSANCVVVIQHDKLEILPENPTGFCLVDQRKYASTVLSLYKVLGCRQAGITGGHESF